MIALERHIEAEQPHRSLLMSYCSGLSFFEHFILSRLQTAGDGAVTVLVDAADYENSFSDAIERAGIDYRLEPVRLSRRFHPKLYLFTKSDTATLFVASANLTKSGFRRNAEIVDRLVVSPKLVGDARALLQYAELLESLSALYAHFSKSVQYELARTVEFIRHLTHNAQVETVGPVGPLFLHNATTPLLHQVMSFIPGKDINEVVLISPYFDPGCVAIRDLATACPNACFRIIRADEDGNLNGAALKSLKERLTVETFLGYGKGNRALHGKVAIFRGSITSWVITGSANLTSSAWLRPAFANEAGNLEAVVLRGGTDLGTELAAHLRTRKVAIDALHYLHVKTPETDFGRDLVVHDAVLKRGFLTITGVLLHRRAGQYRVSVAVEQNGLRTDLSSEASQDDTKLRIVARVSGKAISDSENSCVVTVQLRWTNGTTSEARRWISRPDLLILPASERRTRSSVRSVCQQLFADAEGQIILNAIGKFISDIGELAIEGDSINSSGNAKQQDKPRTAKPDQSEISLDGFLTNDLEVKSFGRSHRQHAATLMEQLASALRRIIVEPTDDLPDDEEPEVGQVPKDEAPPHKNPTEKENKRQQASELVEEVLGDVVQAVDKAHLAPLHPSAIPFVIKVPEAIGAFGLFRLRVNSVLEQSVANDFSYNLRRMLVSALSIDGVMCGGTFGWLVRAWCYPDTHDELLRCVLNEDYWANLRAFTAAAVSLGEIGIAEDAQMQSVMAGVALITGAEFLDDDKRAKVSTLLDHLVNSSSGKLERKGLDTVLTPMI